MIPSKWIHGEILKYNSHKQRYANYNRVPFLTIKFFWKLYLILLTYEVKVKSNNYKVNSFQLIELNTFENYN